MAKKRSAILAVKIISDASKVADGFGKTEGRLAKFGRTAKRILKTGVAAGVGLVAETIRRGFGRLVEIENAEAALKGLGFSAKEVAAITQDALAAVEGTAYGLGEAMVIAAPAISAGVKPGKELQRYLTLVADAAANAQVDLSHMAEMMGKVEGAGKITGTVLNQMEQNGLYAATMLAEHFGKSTEQIRKMASAGQISADDFKDALEAKIGGAAKAMGDTTVGAWRNMWAAVSRVGASFLSGIFPSIRGGLSGIGSAFNAVGPYAEAWGEKLGQVLGRVADWVKGTALPALRDVGAWMRSEGIPAVRDFSEWLGNVLGPFLRDIADFVTGTVVPAVAGFVAGMRDGEGAGGVFVTVLQGIVSAAKDVAEWLSENREVVWGLIGAYAAFKTSMAILATYRAITTTITAAKQAYAFATYGQATAEGGFFVKAASALGIIKAKTAALLTNTKAAIGNAASSIAAGAAIAWTGLTIIVKATARWVLNTAAIVGNRVAMVAVTGASYALAAAQGVLRGAQMALNVAMRANPIGLIITAVVALVAGIVLLYKRSETFRNIVQAIGRYGREAFKIVIDHAKTLVGWIKGLWTEGSTFRRIVTAAFRAVTTPARTMRDVVKRIVDWVKNIKIPSGLKRAVETATAPLRTMRDVISRIVEWIRKIKFPSPPKWLTDLGSSIGLLSAGPEEPMALMAATSGHQLAAAAAPTAAATQASTPSMTQSVQAGIAQMVALATQLRRASTTNTYYIVVNGAVDPVATKRQLDRLMRRGNGAKGVPV